jgi:ribosomal protein L29
LSSAFFHAFFARVRADVGSRSIDELAAERDELLLGLLELRTKPANATAAKRATALAS